MRCLAIGWDGLPGNMPRTSHALSAVFLALMSVGQAQISAPTSCEITQSLDSHTISGAERCNDIQVLIHTRSSFTASNVRMESISARHPDWELCQSQSMAHISSNRPIAGVQLRHPGPVEAVSVDIEEQEPSQSLRFQKETHPVLYDRS